MIKVKVVKNEISDLPKKLQKYAYGQDQNGNLDIALDEEYVVYGVRELLNEVFYLIEREPSWLWWMPSYFYSPSSDEILRQIPDSWVRKETSDSGWHSGAVDVEIAPQLYHDNTVEIEDYTEKGQRAVEQIKQGNKDVPSLRQN